MRILGTRDNASLATAVNGRVAADARLIRAKAALWMLGGIGLMSFGIGVGIAVALLAYARLNDRSTAAQEIANSIAKALADARLTVALDPNSTVRLAPDSEVTARGTVSLDPNARVVLSGNALPRPTSAQLNAGAAPQTKANVTTNYTVFKSVQYGRGQVDTGYKFSPDSDVPKYQYCYYTEEVEGEGAAIKIDLAADKRFRAPKARNGFDAVAAAANCVWFDGGSTAF